jgi:hypothetical protein
MGAVLGCSKPWRRNLESNPVRPEVAAFRELDALVRKLTDQLAGYRRRAMAAEAKAKELELSLERAVAKGESALAAARAEAAGVRRLLDEARSQAEQITEGAAEPVDSTDSVALIGVPGIDSTDHSTYGDIAVENERLRTRLGEARERTTVLVERVRFLRQQMMQGAER